MTSRTTLLALLRSPLPRNRPLISLLPRSLGPALILLQKSLHLSSPVLVLKNPLPRNPHLRSLRPLLRSLRPLLRSLSPLLRSLRPLLSPLLRSLRPLLRPHPVLGPLKDQLTSTRRSVSHQLSTCINRIILSTK